MVRVRNTHAVCCEDNYFPREKFKLLIVCVTRCTLFFQCVCFLLPICLPCISCGTYCNEDKCCVVTHRTADFRVDWLVYLACLRSHALRAYCNFESKQAISITLFRRRPNKTLPNYCDWPQMYRRHLLKPSDPNEAW